MNENKQSQTNHVGQWVSQASPALLIKIGLFFLVSIALVFLFAWLIFGDGVTFTPKFEQSVSAAESIGMLAQPGLVEMQVDGVDLGVVQQFDPPRTVEINGFPLDVSNQTVTYNDLWQKTELTANQVSWLENSIINYVFRVPGSRGMRDVLENGAATHSTITLTTAQGNQFLFTLTEASEQSISSRNQAFQQNKPAITLLWLDENSNGSSYVVTGTYAPANDSLPAVLTRSRGLETAVSNNEATHNLAVKLESAEVEANGLQLLVRGIVTNKGTDMKVIGAQDIILMSDDLVSQIITIAPPLPWQIPPQNSQMMFTITFQHPPEANALLTVGPQSYELSFAE